MVRKVNIILSNGPKGKFNFFKGRKVNLNYCTKFLKLFLKHNIHILVIHYNIFYFFFLKIPCNRDAGDFPRRTGTCLLVLNLDHALSTAQMTSILGLGFFRPRSRRGTRNSRRRCPSTRAIEIVINNILIISR